jgi:hypothetical protein
MSWGVNRDRSWVIQREDIDREEYQSLTPVLKCLILK